MFYIISQQFNSSLCLGFFLAVLNLAWRRKWLCYFFPFFFFSLF